MLLQWFDLQGSIIIARTITHILFQTTGYTVDNVLLSNISPDVNELDALITYLVTIYST